MGRLGFAAGFRLATGFFGFGAGAGLAITRFLTGRAFTGVFAFAFFRAGACFLAAGFDDLPSISAARFSNFFSFCRACSSTSEDSAALTRAFLAAFLASFAIRRAYLSFVLAARAVSRARRAALSSVANCAVAEFTALRALVRSN